MFFRLRDGLENGKLRATHTSMITNEATFAWRDENNMQDPERKPMRFIDFPGHRRLRPVLFANLEDCRAMILVLDACKFSAQGLESRHTAHSAVATSDSTMMNSSRDCRANARPLDIHCSA